MQLKMLCHFATAFLEAGAQGVYVRCGNVASALVTIDWREGVVVAAGMARQLPA